MGVEREAMSDKSNNVLVIIPTYNEAENISDILSRVRTNLPEADILVVDDASPDGTGDIADNLSLEDSHIHVLHRQEKTGLGDAYLAGFDWGLKKNYDVLVEMDADGSHPANRLPALIDALNSPAHPGLAIGSRWVQGGSVINWAQHRLWLSQGGNAYVRMMLGIPTRDATAGFRAFRADVLRTIHLEDVHSHGYCFQVDLTLRVLDAGFGIVELPIEFTEREKGISKMSTGIVVEAMARVTLWGIQRRLRRVLKREKKSPRG